MWAARRASHSLKLAVVTAYIATGCVYHRSGVACGVRGGKRAKIVKKNNIQMQIQTVSVLACLRRTKKFLSLKRRTQHKFISS